MGGRQIPHLTMRPPKRHDQHAVAGEHRPQRQQRCLSPPARAGTAEGVAGRPASTPDNHSSAA